MTWIKSIFISIAFIAILHGVLWMMLCTQQEKNVRLSMQLSRQQQVINLLVPKENKTLILLSKLRLLIGLHHRSLHSLDLLQRMTDLNMPGVSLTTIIRKNDKMIIRGEGLTMDAGQSVLQQVSLMPFFQRARLEELHAVTPTSFPFQVTVLQEGLFE